MRKSHVADRGGFRLRRALPVDAADVTRCVHAAYARYVERIGKPPGPMLDDYAKMIREHDVFVAVANAGVIGVLVLVRTGDGMLLDNVAVDPSRQGQGVGRALIALAEREARRRGHATLELYTHALMTENIELYRRLGYEETARRNERGYDRVYLAKALAGSAVADGDGGREGAR